jgi:hypothetical protein
MAEEVYIVLYQIGSRNGGDANVMAVFKIKEDAIDHATNLVKLKANGINYESFLPGPYSLDKPISFQVVINHDYHIYEVIKKTVQ